MRPQVKICGITSLEDARFCAGLGADFLGFIQHPESPRYVAPERAREIIGWVYGAQPVGVFVNSPPDVVNAICAGAGFTHAQLHGNESPEECARITVPVIKAFRVLHDASAEQLRGAMEPYRDVAALFLLDTHATDLWGGTGESFNWRLARELSAEFTLILAGGLHAGNVREAVETMRPWGVDASSRLESEPGVKDFAKVQAFFDALDPDA
jgi:phosphoribosylanthranilate isomerase